MSGKDDTHLESDLFGGTLPALSEPRLPPIKRRLLTVANAVADDPAGDVSYQHSVLCQTALPLRRPDEKIRTWDRSQGRAALTIEAGRAIDPITNKWVDLPLPFGPKARLVLIHLNSEAIRLQSPEIEVERSMTAFMRRLMPYHAAPNGREIKAFKDQLSALANATVRFSFSQDGRGCQVNTQIVGAFDFWFPKDERQHVLWPSTVKLSRDYFDSLLKHAVPLDERAVAALSHSAAALDVYAWLAQRLHRIPANAPQFIPWTALSEQFGQGYDRIRDFRSGFPKVLAQVGLAYPAARFTTGKGGMTLASSHPPIAKRLHALSAKPKA